MLLSKNCETYWNSLDSKIEDFFQSGSLDANSSLDYALQSVVMPQVNIVSVLTKISKSGEKKLVSARAAHSKARLPYAFNQFEDLINEAIFLTSMNDSFVRLARIEEPNNIYLHLARDGHWQRKWTIVSSSSAGQHPPQKSLKCSGNPSACLPITQWPASTATVIEMMSRPSPSNWLVSLLSIEDHVSLALKQGFSLTQDRLKELQCDGQLERGKWHPQVDWRGFRK